MKNYIKDLDTLEIKMNEYNKLKIISSYCENQLQSINNHLEDVKKDLSVHGSKANVSNKLTQIDLELKCIKSIYIYIYKLYNRFKLLMSNLHKTKILTFKLFFLN